VCFYNLPPEGEVGVRVADGEVHTIAYMTDTDARVSFNINGWKNLIESNQQGLVVGQAMLITGRYTEPGHPLPLILVIDYIHE